LRFDQVFLRFNNVIFVFFVDECKIRDFFETFFG